MRTIKGILALVTGLALTGCISSSVTNLTPRNQSRTPENVYPVEIVFNSNLRTIRPDSIRPYVQIGDDNYLMRHTPVVPNRWETLVPVSASQNLINYRVKVDFQYSALGGPKPNSVLSSSYQLVIHD